MKPAVKVSAVSVTKLEEPASTGPKTTGIVELSFASPHCHRETHLIMAGPYND